MGIFSAIFANESSDAQKDAAKDAARAQEYAVDRAIEVQQPWYDTGEKALKKLEQIMGLDEPDYATAGAGGSTGAGGYDYGSYSSDGLFGGVSNAVSGNADYAQYVRDNPDLLAAFEGSGGRYGDIGDFGRTHYTSHGQNEPNRNIAAITGERAQGSVSTGVYTGGGRDLTGTSAAPGYGSGGANAQSEPSTQKYDPLEDFYGSARGRLAIKGFDQDAMNANAAGAATGRALSGAQWRDLNEINKANSYGAYNDWVNDYANLAGTGQATANGLAATIQNGGNAQAAAFGAIGQAEANKYAGYGAGLQNTVDLGAKWLGAM